MKSTDNNERATADVARSVGSNNFSPASSPNGKAPPSTSTDHDSAPCRPGGVVTSPTSEAQQQQQTSHAAATTTSTNIAATTLDSQSANLLNHNAAIKSLPQKTRPMAPANSNHQNFTVQQQQWQATQLGLPNNQNNNNNNAQVSLNLPCKSVNGFLFQKVNNDDKNDSNDEGLLGTQTMHQSTDRVRPADASVAQGHPPPCSESVLPSERMQTPSRKEVLKRTLLEKSKENARNAARNACLSPISDLDSSNNSDSITSTSKKPIKVKKSTNGTPLPQQQETQMSQSSIYEKLASLGSEPNRKYFLSQLFNFMNANNTPIRTMPVVCRQTVDLFRMYNIVKKLGGMEKVCKMKHWRDVSSALGFGGSTSAGFALKKNYCKYLFCYECKYDRGDVDPNLILVSLDLVSKLETKKKSQEPSQSNDALMKEDSTSQDSFSELSNGLEECTTTTTTWEKPRDLPVFFNLSDPTDGSTRLRSAKNLEYVEPTKFKRRKLTHHDCGHTSMQKIIRSLSSGLLCETSWALDCLSILTHDPSSPPINLSKHPKLLNLLLELIATYMDSLIEHTVDSESKWGNTKLQDQIRLHCDEEDSCNVNHFVLSWYKNNMCENKKFYAREHQELKSKHLKKIPRVKFEPALDNERQNVHFDDDSTEIPRRIVDRLADGESRQEASEPGEDLFCISSDFLSDLARKCICISNILRNLSSMPWNEKELASHPVLLSVLSFFLHYNHEHFENVSQKKEEVDDDDDPAEDATEFYSHSTFRLEGSDWLWSTIVNIRSNCIVTLSHVANHVNLPRVHGEICLKLCKGLLHWGVCQSSEAQDLHSGLNISVQRIALEALSKLCISRSNVDYVVATPPFSLVVNFVLNSVKILHRNDSDVVRDIVLGILARLVAAEDNLARALAVDGSAPFVLLGFIDEYVDPSVIESAAPADNGHPSKTSSYTARKAAEILCQLSRVPENVQYLLRFKKHLLETVTSLVDDSTLTALVSEALSAVG